MRESEIELENECKDFIPLENYDSEIDLEELEDWDLKNKDVPDKIIQIAYSIGGIRRYNYIFK